MIVYICIIYILVYSSTTHNIGMYSLIGVVRRRWFSIEPYSLIRSAHQFNELLLCSNFITAQTHTHTDTWFIHISTQHTVYIPSIGAVTIDVRIQQKHTMHKSNNSYSILLLFSPCNYKGKQSRFCLHRTLVSPLVFSRQTFAKARTHAVSMQSEQNG